jgi:hypothetical protein
VPLVTNANNAKLFVDALLRHKGFIMRSWDEYTDHKFAAN